jgi:osmotically-inducible protein OsmY
MKEVFPMTGTMRSIRAAFMVALLAGALLSLPKISAVPAQQENSAESAAASQLNKKQFHDVKVTVDSNGVATLRGTVDVYENKADAQKRVLRAKGVAAVRNLIEVGGPSIPDKQLEDKLREQLAYDRVGYGNVFDAITLKVENGVATLGGHSHDYPARDSALGLVATTPGVKGVVDEIEVDPASSLDWQTRMAVARAVYGFPALNKYAIDPAKPIRISVQNGNVELYGVVDSQADKDMANIRANGVPGVFTVKNYLQVANQHTEAQK